LLPNESFDKKFQFFCTRCIQGFLFEKKDPIIEKFIKMNNANTQKARQFLRTSTLQLTNVLGHVKFLFFQLTSIECKASKKSSIAPIFVKICMHIVNYSYLHLVNKRKLLLCEFFYIWALKVMFPEKKITIFS